MPDERALSWFEACGSELEQGDVVTDLRVVTPVAEAVASNLLEYAFDERVVRAVVLTQSCDIPKKTQYNILVAEVHDYVTVARRFQHLQSTEYREALSRGTAISDFLLPPETSGGGWSIISFRDLYLVPKPLVVSAASNAGAVRLLSPYREYLSQSFARFMMRVALPVTLSRFLDEPKP